MPEDSSASNQTLGDMLHRTYDGEYQVYNNKIFQVSPSNEIDGDPEFDEVDTDHLTLDMSSNYDLMQSLIKEASAQGVDVSSLILSQVQSYPTAVIKLQDFKKEVIEANKSLDALQQQLQNIKTENVKLQQEINDLKISQSSQPNSDQSKAGNTKTDSSDQTAANKTADSQTSNVQKTEPTNVKPIE